MAREFVLVIDFGGQYAHLISRRLRELGVYTRVVPDTADKAFLASMIESSAAVVFSGGPGSVNRGAHDGIAVEALERGKPVLGICYGHQLLARVMGGSVARSPRPEFGPTIVRLVGEDPLLASMPRRLRVWMSHKDAVVEPPRGSKVLAVSDGSPVAAFSSGRVWGVQWHPEVSHSEQGLRLLSNWIDILGIARSWEPADMIGELVEAVKREVGDMRAVAAVSGGVDSTVAALIARMAVGDRLVPVMIDHGLMPEGEPGYSVSLLRRAGLPVRLYDFRGAFLESLSGVRDPEEKRRVFGLAYARALEEIAGELDARVLVQGTIYPDVIESGGSPGSDVIKTHHNVGGMPESFSLKVVEPLRMLYKDEVRKIARRLGVPREIIYRQPFPGPGLSIRVEGEVTEDKLRAVRKADSIVREEVEARGLHKDLWQYFAVLTESRSTGVKGDERAYGSLVIVRMVQSRDAMTANPARVPWDLLERIANRIVSEVEGVVRVAYDITSKPPGTIEWE